MAQGSFSRMGEGQDEEDEMHGEAVTIFAFCGGEHLAIQSLF